MTVYRIREIQQLYNQQDFDIDERIDLIVKAYKTLKSENEFQNLFKELRKSNKEIRDTNTDKIKYQHNTLSKIYKRYVLAHNSYYQTQKQNRTPKKRKVPVEQIENVDYINEYPFKSKIKYFSSDKSKESYNPRDFKLKPVEKLYRPYHSPKLGSWEVDIIYAPSPIFKNQSIYYLFYININTKYLVVYLLENMTKSEILRTLNKLIKDYFVSNIRGDGQFSGIKISNTKIYSNPNAATNHNRCVDRVIKTIRDGIGGNYYNFANFDYLNNIVNIYNKTPHDSLTINKHIFTPAEVQSNRDLEGILIRLNEQILETVKEEQEKEGLFKFKKGNVLLVHLDLSRTPYAFIKTRRTFNYLAVFLEYEHGNVKVKLLNPTNLNDSEIDKKFDKVSNSFNINKPIIIPIYYCKYLCESVKDIPNQYRIYFL
jgi:hypothetical protein